jgi:hypothetical protein
MPKERTDVFIKVFIERPVVPLAYGGADFVGEGNP